MKKLLSVLFVTVLALSANAQVIYRSGDKYFADGQPMNKQMFAAHMQQNAEAQLAQQFRSGLTVANVGWGLFGGGLAMELAGCFMIPASASHLANEGGQGVAPMVGMQLAGAWMIVLGGCVTTASIVCLGVGYARMHNSADVFVATVRDRQRPQAYLSLQTSRNGLGLALNF